MRLADRLWDKIADRLAERQWRALEDANELPLPAQAWDVIVDDVGMAGRHEYRLVFAGTATAAAVEAYKRAMRDEGFRCVAAHPPGDERTLEVARDVLSDVDVSVHRAGCHPGIDYDVAPSTIVRVG